MLIVSLTSIVNAFNSRKWVSLINEIRMIEPTPINLHQDEYSQAFYILQNMCWCECECRKCHRCEKDYVWNPATCNCENGKYLAIIMDDSSIMSWVYRTIRWRRGDWVVRQNKF